MTRILCTGAAGYIGSILVPELLAKGHHVTAIDTFRHGENSLAQCCANPKFEAVRCDVRDIDRMKPHFERADVVIPLAAVVGMSACRMENLTATSVNASAIQDMCHLLHPAQVVIFPNTNSGYGIGTEKACTEDSPLRPVSLYGITKCHAEDVVMRRANSVALRLATVFGASPKMRLDLLVNDFVYRAVTDRFVVLFESHFRRNFVHVRDVVSAFIHCINNFERMKGEVYNVGDSRANLTKRQLCETIQKHVPDFTFLEAPVGEDPDKRDYLVSVEKFEVTGWQPNITLEEGIEELKKQIACLGARRHTNA